jgi:hypothetical protein
LIISSLRTWHGRGIPNEWFNKFPPNSLLQESSTELEQDYTMEIIMEQFLKEKKPVIKLLNSNDVFHLLFQLCRSRRAGDQGVDERRI